MSGAVMISASAAHTTSNRRFAMLECPAYGHEGFRGLEALLIAPGTGAIAQRLEWGRMRIGTELARVARHRGELVLERGGDVYPRIGGERAREGPLRTAGGIER